MYCEQCRQQINGAQYLYKKQWVCGDCNQIKSVEDSHPVKVEFKQNGTQP